MRTEINIALGKNEGYMPSSLGVGQLVWAGRWVGGRVGRQAGSEMKIFAI